MLARGWLSVCYRKYVYPVTQITPAFLNQENGEFSTRCFQAEVFSLESHQSLVASRYQTVGSKALGSPIRKSNPNSPLFFYYSFCSFCSFCSFFFFLFLFFSFSSTSTTMLRRDITTSFLRRAIAHVNLKRSMRVVYCLS